MTKQGQWAIGGLALLIVGFVALQVYLYVDLQNFKEGLKETRIEPETPTIPNVVISEEKPEDVPGFKWVRHGDHWDLVPIDNPNQPIEHPSVQITEDSNETPDYIYDPDREKPDGWDPELVFEDGETKIDLNFFRLMTEEERAEYERLKKIKNPNKYSEADLRFMAIVYVQTKLVQEINSARRTPEHEKLLAEYDRLYGRFPVSY